LTLGYINKAPGNYDAAKSSLETAGRIDPESDVGKSASKNALRILMLVEYRGFTSISANSEFETQIFLENAQYSKSPENRGSKNLFDENPRVGS
jgi:hypothetical protein